VLARCPAARRRRVRATSGTHQHDPQAQSWATHLGTLLNSLDAPARLTLRTHPHYIALRGSVRLTTTLDLDLDLDLDLARDLALALDFALALARARDLTYADARALARQFAGVRLDTEPAGADALRRLRDLLTRVADDFTGANLREVFLTGAALEGIRWSSTTLWPTGWQERIRAASVEIEPGIFEITDTEQKDRELTH
jgi:hypothetical protein